MEQKVSDITNKLNVTDDQLKKTNELKNSASDFIFNHVKPDLIKITQAMKLGYLYYKFKDTNSNLYQFLSEFTAQMINYIEGTKSLRSNLIKYIKDTGISKIKEKDLREYGNNMLSDFSKNMFEKLMENENETKKLISELFPRMQKLLYSNTTDEKKKNHHRKIKENRDSKNV